MTDATPETDGGASGPDEARDGALLAELSNDMVRMHKRYWGRGAVEAKSYLFDDLLLVVMRGGLTIAEESMLQNGHEREVRAFRQLWQDDMTDELVEMVGSRTGRHVVNYQSQVMFDPDVVLEIFMFGRPGSGEPNATRAPATERLTGAVGAAAREVLRELPEAAAQRGDDPARGRDEDERRRGR
ncbi:Na-translocating system protein MpsC family protein [Patulibacter sp.]|uniref:Na-translocating system protein MpsC family protein n=1 Tax=Patulibacter sp. TaxID=1912859 RepID=UPI00271C3542|nr:Na-translocating system protein MpsC family protein [Patulibacter sp.]MDO9410194.1 Na-translocating system protein MpsC family protein [Patulibacter sp.]